MAEKVAIVGIGCRFPGAEDIDEFWEVLRLGKNYVVEVPKNRWNVDAFYDSDTLTPGKTNVRKAGFVEGCEKWDYKFFGINEFESKRMDPQHKLVLDCTYMALENAGITKKSIKGSNTGVYIGVMNTDYSGFISTSSNFDNYTVTGTNNSIVSSRISYIFDLHGTSMSIDTACSSSLMAIHLAHQAILSGECDMAIAGGVNLMLSPDISVQLSKAGMVSPTGQCQAFSENADGYARGEGCGIVILKSYQKAVEDNDPIWATISTASNHDGHTVSPITTPSEEQQIKLLHTVFSKFDVDPQTVDYIEAHGTGTKAGDPVEVKALGRFFEKANNSTPKYIGSVKTNIGHLEPAAGVASVIKVLLMHKHQQIVKSLHFERPSQDVPLEKYRFTVPVELQDWPASNREFLRSSVNSFSFGGSNCHAIVTTNKLKANNQSKNTLITQPKVVCLSAVQKESLKMMKNSMCDNVKDYQLADLSYTSTVRRNHYPFRLAVFGKNIPEIIENLKQININKHVEKYNANKQNKLIYLCAGLGTNWDGMCQQLLNKYRVFGSIVDEITKLLKQYVSWDLSEYLRNGCDTGDANIGPIITFACQVSLVVLLKTFGIHPDAIIGQSIGEVAASFASGAVSLEQAVYIIYHRTRVQAQGIGGRMFVAMNIEIDKIQEVLRNYELQASVAVYSSPQSCTISCDENIVDRLKKEIMQVDADCILKDLNVTSAFHSHHMSASSEEMKTCTEISGVKPTIDTYSTVSGLKAKEGDFITPQYWADNIREPVKLYQAVLEAHDPSKNNIFVEIGSQPILKAHLPNIFRDDVLFDSIPLMKIKNETNCITEAVCNFYNYGVDVQWQCFDDLKANVVDYPKYKFNRVDNMFVPKVAREKLMGVDQKTQNHPCVKTLSSDTDNVKVFIDPQTIASIYEHRVNGLVTIPGALYAEVGLALASQRTQSISFQEVTVDFINPLFMVHRQAKELDTKVEVHDHQTNFTVSEGSKSISSGTICRCLYEPVPKIEIEDIRNRCNFSKTGNQIYEGLKKFGFTYGSAMKVIQKCVGNDREALIDLEINDLLRGELKGMILHPAIIDSLLQAPGAFVESETFYTLPIQIRKLRVYSEVQKNMLIYIEFLNSSSKTKLQFKLLLCSTSGDPIAGIETFTSKVIGTQEHKPHKMFFVPTWSSISERNSSDKHQALKYLSVSVEPRRKQDEEVNLVIPLVDNIKDLKRLDDILSRYNYVVIFINVAYNDELGGLEMQKTLTDFLLWFKDVLECIKQHEIKRILINLNNTWRIDELCTDPTTMIPENVIHSSLWAGLRSVQRELIETKARPVIHIIDLQDSQTDRLLFIFNKLNGDWKYHGELVVTNNDVFSYQITDLEEPRGETFLSIPDNGDVDFELLSTSRDMVVKNIFKSYARHTSLKEEPGSNLLNVTKLVLHSDELLYPLLADQEHNDEGWPICCLECVGYQERNLLVSCFPVLAANKVMVPLSCCIPYNLIPFYEPGLLSLLIGLWTLTSKLKTLHVTVIHQERSSVYLELLCLILTFKEVEYRVINHNDFSSIWEKEDVICLVDFDKSIIDAIMKSDSICNVIAFSSLLPMNMAAILGRRLRILNVQRIHEPDMFSQANIDTANQGLSKWLTHHKEGIENIMKKMDYSNNPRDPMQRLFKATHIDLLKQDGLKIPIRLTPSRLFSKTSGYIVVGGLRGLGWQCVRWLATQHAGYILIFNRSNPSEKDILAIGELSRLTGCTIKCYSVDAGNISSVKEAIQGFISTHVGIHIKGVFYGAAVLQDSLLSNMTKEQMTLCLTPKIMGAWNLHEATLDMKLDFFLLHSSITATLGASGQSNYGVGNAFQDSLIAIRRKCDRPIQTLNWGPLNVGMLEYGERHERTVAKLSSSGYNLIDKEEIESCLETAILTEKHQIMIANLDLQKIESKSDEFTRQRLHPILPKAFIKLEDSSMPLPFDLQSLKDASADEISQTIKDYVIKLVERILSVTDEISHSTILIEAGMDSMQAMTLVNQVNEDFEGVKVPLNLLFGPETTVETLSKLIEDKYKENERTEFKSENQEDYMNDKISYPELRYLHLNNLETYKAYHHISDLYFGNLQLTNEMTIDFIKTMMIRYPICRALFDWKEGILPERDEVTKSLVDIERAIDIYEVNPNNPDIEEIFYKRYYEKFDTRSKGPVRFTFAISPRSIRLSIVFNHVGFDLIAVNLFVSEIVGWVKSIQYNVNIPLQMPVNQNSVCYILDKVLTEQKTDLQRFWKQQIEMGVPNITMNKNKTFRPKTGHACVSERELPQEIQNMCESLSKAIGTTTNNLYITIYQLLLGTRSKTSRVVINTTVNLRPWGSSSALEKRVECISNHVPIFVNMPSPDTTFEDFFRGNYHEILKTIDHAIYPYTEIVKLIPEGQNKDLDRHEMVFQDFTFVEELSQVADTADLDLKVSGVNSYTGIETVVKVLVEAKKTTFKLMLGGENYNQNDADDFLGDFYTMLECVSKDRTISIKQLQDKTRGVNDACDATF